MRKLATIRKIDALDAIPNADAIEVATVDGWKVVVKKNEFKVGEYVVYIEIDSWVPYELAPFLSKGKEPREFNGVKGERLRTIKLRGQISQGLVLPRQVALDKIGEIEIGMDVSDLLGIQKWEAPLPRQLVGQAKGYFPPFIPKTDQERIQNCFKEVKTHTEPFEVTIKLDGSSMTVYHNNGEVGICSRNLELKINEENKDNTFIRLATSSGILDALKKIGRNIAIQGELMGPGIQGNRENLQDFRFYTFDIFDIDKQKYLLPEERYKIQYNIFSSGVDVNKITVVPILELERNLNDFNSVEDFLSYAEGESIVNPVREGVVFKSHISDFSFKAISNSYLLKGGE